MNQGTVNRKAANWLSWGVGIGIVFPLFFQIRGGIYRDIELMRDSGGVLATLPLPVSIPVCVGALALLTTRVGQARQALVMVLAVLLASGISLWLGGDGVTAPQRKLIMAAQVMLPLAGLLLGQMMGDPGKAIARAFLVVLSLVVPLQLLATWLQGEERITHYLYVFSIYSHWQYVPVIFVCAYVYALTSLWGEYKRWLCILMIPMFAYVTRSFSFLTILPFGFVVFAFAVSRVWPYRANVKSRMAQLLLIAAVVAVGVYAVRSDGQAGSGLFMGKFAELAEGRIPGNVQERFNDWRLFGTGIVESGRTFLVGHPQPMPREIRTSPHNWYLDVAYTFGIIALLPVFALAGYTACLCWKQRKTLSAETWWLLAIVAFLVVVDSNFKVTLRQPYPGIFAFFMWGLLLANLRPSAAGKADA
ncbi:O-antigen ligase family protein [Sulfuritalea hydrogenivorans]|uniref:O-antigen polymerase n=1 Tax=Sulfuritalea hydrogenivorans sk43H TaxID=1223802 RepID=W0SK04_9PROT|nr:hypothetical protein [Sulfuritalea hydrogenivorans]BAO31156.1 hypothetical protein SUTH_03386 [Sulfuritalea hydrogenivorans sk43H]